jgi:Leucine-rich repeat (LRR) protein
MTESILQQRQTMDFCSQMEENPDRSLVPVPDGSLANTRAGAKRILSTMVAETLALTRERTSLQPAQWSIGAHELCEPDYRQILAWSEALGSEPEETLRRLLDDDCLYVSPFGPKEVPSFPIGYRHFDLPPTAIVNGRIVTLTWNFKQLPLRAFIWVEGLEIESMNIWPGSRDEFSFLDDPGIPTFCPSLPKLRRLFCDSVGINELGLEGVPKLVELKIKATNLAALYLESVPLFEKVDCSDNHLKELNLCHSLELRELRCGDNFLSELDLSNNPNITELDCCRNRDLGTLDLSPVTKLEKLWCRYCKFTSLDLRSAVELVIVDCSDNQLTSLSLGELPKLREFLCGKNSLSAIDLSRTPQVSDLSCDENHLSRLDLFNLPVLSTLSCSHNQLAALDLSKAPQLTILYCEANRLAKLNLTDVSALEVLSCEGNLIDELDIRPLRHLWELSYDPLSARLVQRADQSFLKTK